MGVGNNITITLTVEEANALKAWQSQQVAVDKLKRKLGELEIKRDPLSPLKSGAKEALSNLTQCMVAITGIGSAIAGVMAIANQLRKEVENVKSRQAGAAGAHVEFATEMAQAVRATAKKLTGPEIEQLVNKGSQQTGQTPTVVARAYNAAFTAKGPRNREEALQRIEEANAVMAQYPEQDAQTTAQLVAVTSLNKEAFGLNTQQAIGYQQQAQNVSFVKDIHSFAANVGGKLSGIAKSGDATAAQAGALAGTFSQAGGDFEGSTSTLAALTFAAELKERLPNLKTFQERLAFMQKDYAENTRKYLEGGEFNGKKFSAAETGRSVYKAHVVDMLNPNSKLAKEYQANVQEYGDNTKWEQTAEAVRKEVESTPSIQIARGKQAGETSKQQLQLDDVVGAAAATAREALIENLKASGETDLAQQIAGMKFEYNAGMGSAESPFTQAANQIGSTAEYYENSKALETIDDGFGNEYTVRGNGDKTPEQIEADTVKAKRLRNLESKLRQTDKQLRETHVARQAEAAHTDVSDEVAKYEADPNKTPEKLAALRTKYDEGYRAVEASERIERGKLPGEGRARLDRYKELEKRINGQAAQPGKEFAPATPQAAAVEKSDMQPAQRVSPAAAMSMIDKTKAEVEAALADGQLSSEESTSINQSFALTKRGTNSAVRGIEESGGSMGDRQAINDSFRALAESIDRLNANLKENTAATAAASKPAKQDSLRSDAPTPRAVPLSTALDARNRGGG